MRNFQRVLAIVLLALMLVGMIPFSLFAEEGTDTPADDIAGKTYAEQIADYVAKNNGILYFAHDYEGENLVSSNNRVYSLVGGKSSMALTPKSPDTVTIEDGAILVSSTTLDPFAQMSVSQGDTAGKDMVIEVSVKGENLPSGAVVIKAQEYLKTDDGKNDKIAAYDLVVVNGGNYVTARNKKPLADATTGEFVSIKVVVKFALNMAYYFVNDTYVCADQLIDGTYNYGISVSGKLVAAPSLVRFGHFTGKNVEGGAKMWIDDTYVYSASVPYGCTLPETDSYILGELGNYLSEKGQRLLYGYDMEGDATSLTLSGNALTVDAGTMIPDLYYNHVTQTYDASKIGTGYNLGFSYLRGGSNFLIRGSLASIVEIDGNNVLAVDQTYPYNGHTYMDMSLNGHTAGTSFVASMSIKRYETYNFGHTLMSWRWENMGKGESGTAADGSKGTYGGNGSPFYGEVSVDANGALYMTDQATGTKIKVGQLTSTEFNTITVVYRIGDNQADAYFNGYKVATVQLIPDKAFQTFTVDGVTYTFDDFSTKDWTVGYGRCNMGVESNKYVVGGHYFDNVVMYTGEEPIEFKSDEALNGWVQENGYWRYYENGTAVIGNKVIGGVEYHFEKDGAYASEKVRTPLVDLEKMYPTNSGDGLVNGVANSVHLAPSVKVEGSGKYTYLWADIYKDSNTTGGNTNITIALGAKFTANGTNTSVNYYSGVLTNKDTLMNDGNPENDYTGRLMLPNKAYINLNGYYAIEAVVYGDLENDIGSYWILSQDNWSTSLPTYTTKWAHSSGLCGRQQLVVFKDGWNSYTYYLDNQYKNLAGGEFAFGDNRFGGFDRITTMAFQPGWSSTNTKYQNYNTAKLYFDNFYLVDYVPTKDIPAAGFRTTAEGTYYYEKSYDFATGWKTIDGGDYYFYPYNGIMAVGNAVVEGVGMTFDDDGKLLDATATGWFTVDGIECVYVEGVLQTGAFEFDGKSYYASCKGEIFSDVGEIGYIYDKAYAPSYLTSVTDVMLAVNFEDKTPGSFVGSYSGKSFEGSYVYWGGSNLNLVAKITHLTFVQDGENNIALEVTNRGALVDTYVNINLGHQVDKDADGKVIGLTYKDSANEATISAKGDDGKYRDLVFEFDLKLGDDWNADVLIF